MGFLSWLRGGDKAAAAADPKASWLRARIAERKSASDAYELAVAAEVLGGAGTQVFGMVIGELAERAAIRDEAIEALRELVPSLPPDDGEEVFDVIVRAKLPIDVTAQRARIAEERAAAIAKREATLRARLETSTPEQLVEACCALIQHQRKVLDIDLVGLDSVRAPLLEVGLARLAAAIPELTPAQCDALLPKIRRARLPIDVSARSIERAETRRDERTAGLARATGAEPRDAALEAAIEATLEATLDGDGGRDGGGAPDAAAWSVYADWLAERGHPRGELMQLQLRAETDRALMGAAAACLDRHAAALLGPLVAHMRVRDGSDRDTFTWRRGFLDGVLLSQNDDAAENVWPDRLAVALATILAHPSARYLRRVEIGINGTAYDDDLADVLEALAAAAPPFLRELVLGEIPDEEAMISNYRIGDVSRLWHALPRLRTLSVRGAEIELGDVAHAELVDLRVKSGGLPAQAARAVAAAKLPKLRRLDVWFGDVNYGADATLVDIRPLLGRADLPGLTHLALANADFADELPAALAASTLAAQLTTLDLAKGTLSDTGARALVARASSFPGLAHLDVSESYVSPAAIAELRRAFPRATVVADDQRGSPDDEDRYVAVGE